MVFTGLHGPSWYGFVNKYLVSSPNVEDMISLADMITGANIYFSVIKKSVTVKETVVALVELKVPYIKKAKTFNHCLGSGAPF